LAVFRRIHKKRVHLAVIILMPISRGWAQNPISECFKKLHQVLCDSQNETLCGSDYSCQILLPAGKSRTAWSPAIFSVFVNAVLILHSLSTPFTPAIFTVNGPLTSSRSECRGKGR